MLCVLCSCRETSLLPEAGEYFHCPQCDVRFLHPNLRLSYAEEKSRYDLHCNDVNDSRYLEFLEPLYSQLQTRLAPESEGMDFGCGPGPALASLFRRAGHHVTLYDPFYHPDKNALDKQYDFISASEVFEHLYNPATEIQKLRRLLKPRGWLGVMTQLVDEQTDFANWYYRRDPTHVVFFSLRSFAWIAHGFGFSEPIHCGPRVVLLQTR